MSAGEFKEVPFCEIHLDDEGFPYRECVPIEVQTHKILLEEISPKPCIFDFTLFISRQGESE